MADFRLIMVRAVSEVEFLPGSIGPLRPRTLCPKWVYKTKFHKDSVDNFSCMLQIVTVGFIAHISNEQGKPNSLNAADVRSSLNGFDMISFPKDKKAHWLHGLILVIYLAIIDGGVFSAFKIIITALLDCAAEAVLAHPCLRSPFLVNRRTLLLAIALEIF